MIRMSNFLLVLTQAFVLVALLFISCFSFGQDVFQKSNEAYKNANYETAIKGYESILAAKKQSPELYFNLGNAHYKLNQIGPAIYYYEKALQLNPKHKDAKINLSIANQKKIDAIKEKPKVGFEALLRKFTSFFHYDTWAIWSIVNVFLVVACFISFSFVKTTFKKRLFFIGILLFAFLMLISLSAGFFERNMVRNEVFAIVFEEEILVKNEPVNQASDAFKLHEGTKVEIISEEDNWSKIYINDDLEGWVLSNQLKKL